VHLLRKKSIKPWLLKALVAMTFSGWLATLAGWYVTEIGRQPWLVSGVLTTRDAVTSIAPANIALSLTLYSVLYAGLLVAYVHTLFYMARQSITVDEYETAPTVNYSSEDSNYSGVQS
jgi:cytochrome d ubiquinol oxidase subunit I